MENLYEQYLIKIAKARANTDCSPLAVAAHIANIRKEWMYGGTKEQQDKKEADQKAWLSQHDRA